MKKEDLFNLPLTAIFVEDPNIGGYTAFFKQLSNIITEGETQDEAYQNLINAVMDVFEYQSKSESLDLDPSLKVIQKSVNLSAHECV